MSPTRIRECLATLGWSQRGLARVLDRPEGVVRGWARGAAPAPSDIAAWLEKLARFHEANPPPAPSLDPVFRGQDAGDGHDRREGAGVDDPQDEVGQGHGLSLQSTRRPSRRLERDQS